MPVSTKTKSTFFNSQQIFFLSIQASSCKRIKWIQFNRLFILPWIGEKGLKPDFGTKFKAEKLILFWPFSIVFRNHKLFFEHFVFVSHSDLSMNYEKFDYKCTTKSLHRNNDNHDIGMAEPNTILCRSNETHCRLLLLKCGKWLHSPKL